MVAPPLLVLTGVRLLAKPAASGKDAGGVQEKPRAAAGARRRLIRVSVAEARRFFVALFWGTTRVLGWSNGRRHHQAPAKFFHDRSRHALVNLPL